MTIRELDARLWKLYSERIRRQHADENGNVTCCTCGRIKPWRRVDAGHCITRAKKATKYDDRNVHPQCKQCNAWQGGRVLDHVRYINQRYGAGTFDELDMKSRMACRRDRAVYLTMIYEEQEKLDRLGGDA